MTLGFLGFLGFLRGIGPSRMRRTRKKPHSALVEISEPWRLSPDLFGGKKSYTNHSTPQLVCGDWNHGMDYEFPIILGISENPNCYSLHHFSEGLVAQPPTTITIQNLTTITIHHGIDGPNRNRWFTILKNGWIFHGKLLVITRWYQHI